jgi:hypothetical protein
MPKFLRAKQWMVLAALGAVAVLGAAAQSKPAPAATPAPIAASSQEIGDTQQQFLKLLRSSPTLTTVLAYDPSLLSDPSYVTRNNPELARFLTLHPEVAQNPDFYLFSKVGPGQRERALAREVWPDIVPEQHEESELARFAHNLVPIIIFPAFFLAIIWMTRLFVENRRWSRTFKMQCDVHARLIDKFGSSQELIAYMETEAGRRFLEATPIPTSADQRAPMPNVLSRILTPVQIGLVLFMLGAGMLLIRNASHDTEVPMQVMGTLLLMPGLGFILSAGLTWFLAGRLGLMPAKSGNQIPAPRNDE